MILPRNDIDREYEPRKSEEKKSDDYVSRADIIEKWNTRSWLYTSFEDFMKDIPSVTPTQSWIPVSERLPDIDDYTDSEVWQEKVLITGYLSFDDTKSLFVSEAFAKDIICNRVHDTIVIAWQPLPKPYEEKRGNEK